MENPNEYVGLHLANDYIKDRHQFDESRRLLKQMKRTKPGRFYCAICRTLASFGHLSVAFGGRLERYCLVLRQSKIKP